MGADFFSRGLFFGMLMLVHLVLLLDCLSAQGTTRTQSSSNGREFFIGFMQNLNSAGSLQLTIGTTLTNAAFVVEYGDGVWQNGTTTSNSPAVIEISNDFQVSDSSYENRQKGIHVYAMDESTIFVIVENFVSPFNHGVFLAYPCLTFETDGGYEYFVISTEGSDALHSQVLLIGCEDNTDISVIPSQMVSLPDNLQSGSSASVDVEVDGTLNLTINRLQTLLISSSSDLTGTKIVSNKPLTVISGHECATVLAYPGITGGCEPLAVQVPPTITWGTRFLLGHFGGRNDLHIESVYKIVTNELASVSVQCGRLNGTLEITLLPRKSFSFAAVRTRYCSIQSSHPILVIQQATNAGIGGRGDPAIALISPVDQYVNEVSFFALPWETFFTNYITVTVQAEHYSPTSILFNGKTIDCEWTEIFSATDTLPIGYGCEVPISTSPDNSTHTLHTVSHENENGLISVLVYGFNDESGYAYLAGQKITLGNSSGIDTFPEEDDIIPFFNITMMLGVSELRREIDAVSQPIYIPNGVIFGHKLATAAYVNENGVISFDEPWRFSYPNRFPTNYFYSRQSMVIAPFWSDNDIRREGTVRYSTFCNISNEAECTHDRMSESYQESMRILNTVNQYIQTTHDPEFIGSWLLIAQWDQVHPSPHGDDDRHGISEDILSKTNTYQGIVISNVYRSYGIFTYGCGDIQWSSITNGRGAVIGYNAAANFFFNHRLSGYVFVGDSVSCSSRSSSRKKRQVSSSTVVVSVMGNTTLEDLVKRCMKIRAADDLIALDNAHLNLHLLYPCPSTRSQADEDNARFRPQEDISQCYVSMNFITGIYPLTGEQRFSPTQQCCYDMNGALVTNPDEGYAGTLLLQHPIREREAYEREFTRRLDPYGDKTFRDACCDERLNNSYCGIFFGRRSIGRHDGYQPPALALGNGDPHYRPFDFNNRFHHFQGVGHFIILNLLSSSQNEPEFSIHGHLCRLGWRGVTWHSQLAFGSSSIAFELGRLPGFQVWQTRPTEEDLTQMLENDTTWSSSNGDVKLVTFRRNVFDVVEAYFFEYGVKLSIDVGRLGENYRYTNYKVWVPLSYAGMASGLLGNLDGNDRNDYFERGHETNPLPYYYMDSELYDHWLTWSLSTEESLFSNHSNCPDEFRRKRQAEHSPVTPDQLNFTNEQRMICEDNLQCMFDFAVSGEEDVAVATLTHEKEANSSTEILNNHPPNITAEPTLRVTVGQESMLYLSVNDSGDNFTLSVLGDMPTNSVLEELSRGEFVFRWTLQEITYNPLTFLANNSRGASSLFTPRVEVCSCFNGGNCTLDGILSENATVVLSCLCTQAFDGRFCEEDRNGCSEIQCFEGVECMDVPAPGVGAVCGACPPGYTGDSLKCYDVDECLLNKTLCNHNCTNTDGGYSCSCFDGYQLIEGTNQCENVNECDETSRCQQMCENTVGSFVCNCNEGFTLATDGRNCTANVPCDRACSFGCATVNSTEHCYCPVGFQLDVPEGTQCIDTDECQMNSSCEQGCQNTNGSFTCLCTTGYLLLTDERRCQDIDECLEAVRDSADLCESYPNSECINNEGSFECVCVPGYTVNSSGMCEQIHDELPPMISVMTSQTSIENSVNFTSPILALENFSPGYQQTFREITATAVNSYCSLRTCDLILSSGEALTLTRLTVEAANIAIPSSLIGQNINGQLTFTFYVQVGDAFLSKEYLESAKLQAEALYREAGLLPALSLLTTQPTPTTPITTTRSMIQSDTQIILIILYIAAGAGVSLLLIVIVLLLAVFCYRKYKRNHGGLEIEVPLQPWLEHNNEAKRPDEGIQDLVISNSKADTKIKIDTEAF